MEAFAVETRAEVGGTVSRCVESVTPWPLRDAQMLARPRVTSCSETFHPRAHEPLRHEIHGAALGTGRRIDRQQFGGERNDVSHSAKVADPDRALQLLRGHLSSYVGEVLVDHAILREPEVLDRIE